MKSNFYAILTLTYISILVIGLSLGYYYEHTISSKEEKIYLNQITLLNESINNQKENIAKLNITVEELNKINSDLMYDLKNKSDLIMNYTVLLENYEKKIDAPYGYQRISMFGFNLIIPKNSTITLNGLYESRASNDSGILHVLSYDESTRIFFSWENSASAPPIDAKLDEAKFFYTYMMINGSSRYQEYIKNYNVKYDVFKIKDIEEIRQVIIASWISDDYSRLYYMDVQIGDQSVVDFFNLLINYFDETN